MSAQPHESHADTNDQHTEPALRADAFVQEQQGAELCGGNARRLAVPARTHQPAALARCADRLYRRDSRVAEQTLGCFIARSGYGFSGSTCVGFPILMVTPNRL